MELRHYLRIVQRSWPIVVGLPIAVALVTILLHFVLPGGYQITAAFFVTQRPIAIDAPTITLPDENNLNNWAASEYVLDDVLQLIETRRFAGDIATWLRTHHQLVLDPMHIRSGLTAERKHRMVYLTARAARPEQARLIAEGAMAVLREQGLAYWDRAQTTTLEVSQADLPEQAKPAQGLARLALDTVLRSLLALFLGIGIAFLRHYMDRSLHHSTDLEALGFEVLGTIPYERLAHS